MIAQLLQPSHVGVVEKPRTPVLPFRPPIRRQYYTVVATFIGVQRATVRGALDIPLFNLTRAIGEKPKDATVTAGTLRTLGYDVPSEAELLNSTTAGRRAA